MKTKNKILYTLGIIVGACLLYGVSSGLRSVYGIMLSTISAETGIAYSTASFAIALGQLVFGIAQPIFGVVALKKSTGFVLFLGSILMALGLSAIPFCSAAWMLILFLGILLPIGTGAVSFGLIMSAITPKLGEKTASTASGIVSASSGVGSIIFAPIIQSSFSAVGLKITMLGFAAFAAVLAPVSMAISGKELKDEDNDSKQHKISTLMGRAFRDKNYWFLMIGFFTCGFHMAIIETHLYSQILSFGISDSTAALAFSIYGFATVAGSLGSGFLISRIPMKWVVGSLYGSRVLWIAAFLLLPKNIPVVIAFTAVLGLTGAATVAPTSSLVGKLFGSENIGTFFGIVFLSHQCGSFVSAWLGGICVETLGSYTLVWLFSAALAVCAMCVSYAIKEPQKLSLK